MYNENMIIKRIKLVCDERIKHQPVLYDEFLGWTLMLRRDIKKMKKRFRKVNLIVRSTGAFRKQKVYIEIRKVTKKYVVGVIVSV